MVWVFRKTCKYAFALVAILDIIFVPLGLRYGDSMWIEWLPLIIFLATFCAVGLVMLMYWLIEGKIDTPKNDIDRIRLELQDMEKRINERMDKKFGAIDNRLDTIEKKLRERIF